MGAREKILSRRSAIELIVKHTVEATPKYLAMALNVSVETIRLDVHAIDKVYQQDSWLYYGEGL